MEGMINNIYVYLTTWTHGSIGIMHLASSLVALGAGFVVLAGRKGTRLHGVLGYLYASNMLFVCGSALLKYDLTGSFNLFHAAALASLATLFAAMLMIFRYKKSRERKDLYAHASFMIWSYFGLFIALIAEVITRSFPYLLHGENGWTRFSIMLIALMSVFGYLTARYVGREIGHLKRQAGTA